MNKWNQYIISYHVIQFLSFCISYLEVTIRLWKDRLIISKAQRKTSYNNNENQMCKPKMAHFKATLFCWEQTQFGVVDVSFPIL